MTARHLRFLFFAFFVLLGLPLAGASALAQWVSWTGPGVSFQGPAFLYYAVTTSTNPPGNGITGHNFTLGAVEIEANTTEVLGVTTPHGTTVSISSTQGTWGSAVCTADGGSGNNQAQIFVGSVGSSPTAIYDSITVNVGSTSIQPVQVTVAVFANLAESSPTNGSLCTDVITPTSSGKIDPGSFTPTTNNNANGGNIIWSYTGLCSGDNAVDITNWTAAPGFTLLSGGGIYTTAGLTGFTDAALWEVQATQGSVDPYVTATGENATNGDCYNTAAVALKVSNNGTSAPGSIHVANVTHFSWTSGNSPVNMVVNAPTVGNLRLLEWATTGGVITTGATVTSVTSSDGCTWAEASPESGGNDGTVLWYAQNCSPAPTLQITIGVTGTETLPQFSSRFFDVENANSSSYQSDAGGQTTTSSPTTSDAPTITPGISAGLAIGNGGIGTGPVTGLASGAPTGSMFDLWIFTGQTDSDTADNADALGHVYFSTNATQNWDWSTPGGEFFDYGAYIFK